MRETVKTALSALCSGNVFWIAYVSDGAKPTQYITYNIREYDELYADDASNATSYTVYVDLYSTTDPATVRASIKSAMLSAGFACVEIQDTGDIDPYHISFTFNYVG